MSKPIRRADASDRSGGFTRLPSSRIRQSRVCPGPSPVRRAETSDRSGGFTRLSSSKIHQARVCPRRLAEKNPPFPEKRGISYQNCSSRYAERRLSDPYNVRSHEFYSRNDKQHVGQFGSRHCRATGRAVLLDFRQANPTDTSLPAAARRKKSPVSGETEGVN